jgi:putative spermidine/putrescine transport system substrate-binding protein
MPESRYAAPAPVEETAMNSMTTTRRGVIGGAVGLAALGTRRARGAAAPALPSAPVALNVIDVAGQLQLTQRAMEEYAKANPKLVSKIAFSQAPAPELPGKLKAQQDAGRVDIDLVLTGTDGLSAGIDQKLWVPIVSDYATALPNLAEIYLPGALKMQGLAQDQAVCVVFCPAGPIIEYMPDAVKQPPKTAQELLDWTKAHPKRFIYARPANSGPGRTFLQGLPYILGDKDPMDPDKGWDKTWAYLVELGKNIEYYPTGTGAVMKELAEGSRDMIASHLGWDLNPRILGVVPMEARIGTLAGFHWVTDAQYWAIPRGVSNDKLAVLLDMTKYMLSKPAQAMTWDKGYFYPGPAVRGVPLSMAPQDSQDAVNSVRRDFIDKLITEVPSEVPLPADRLVFAFQRWDQQVGARVGK